MGNQRKMEKKTPPPLPALGKKQGTLSACLGLPIGCMKFLFPKEFETKNNTPCKERTTYFNLNYLIPFAKPDWFGHLNWN
jgi:hypothetical protein